MPLTLPAPRTPLSVAILMCDPLAQARNSFGDALLMRLTKWKSWNDALPAPPPPPPPRRAGLVQSPRPRLDVDLVLVVDVGRLAGDAVDLEEPALRHGDQGAPRAARRQVFSVERAGVSAGAPAPQPTRCATATTSNRAVMITAPMNEPISPLGRTLRPSPAMRLNSSPPMNEPTRPATRASDQSMPGALRPTRTAPRRRRGDRTG